MADPGVDLRAGRCHHCRRWFWVCLDCDLDCDHGECYCSDRCRGEARLERHRAANRKYQQSKKGRRAHSARQRAYRLRLAVRPLKSMLYQLSPLDPVSFVLAVVAMIAVSGCAVLLPARRAASVDPMQALRAE